MKVETAAEDAYSAPRSGGQVPARARENPPTDRGEVPAAAEVRGPRPDHEIRAIQARLAERLSQYLKETGRALEFRVDADAHATVITVRRTDTGEVVRQFPTEEALAMMQRLNEQSGTFLDELA